MADALDGRVDVVVVGAGVNGLAAAREIARAGSSVLVLEQHDIGNHYGGSRGDARVFAFVHPEPEWVPMCVESLALWRELEEERGVQVLDELGGLYGTRSVERLLAPLEANHVRYEVLDPRQTADRFPVTVPDDMTVVYTPDSGTFAADAALRTLADSAIAHGARLATGTTVLGIDDDGRGVVVRTSDGDVLASTVVVAAGAWSANLLQPLGIDLQTWTMRGTVAYFPITTTDYMPPLFEEGKPSVYSAVSPSHGLKLGESRIGPRLDAGVLAEPDAESAARLADRVRERFPGADPDRPHLETCQFMYTPDTRFRIARQGRIVTGAACDGRAFKFATLTGRQVAGLVAEALLVTA